MNHKLWAVLLVPFSLAAVELVFGMWLLNSNMDGEGKLLAVTLASGLVLLILIPLTLTLIAIANRDRPLAWWSFFAAFLVPSVPNMILQLHPSLSIMYPSFLPRLLGATNARAFEDSPIVFIFTEISYLILYAVIGLIAYRPVRRSPAAAAVVGTLASLAILGFVTLREYGIIPF